jgi:nitroimidazol reductase NimA-like FMN-containing flavoprotein (pyridoxamine 5'-phosphate oxidase superfamily)
MRSLDWDECLERLRGATVGRVAFTHQALPFVAPVNYTLLGRKVVFRTAAEGMIARGCDGAVVAFEVDELSPDGQYGWSVVVVGPSEPLDGSAALRAVESNLVSAVGEGRDVFIAISLGQVTGRSVGYDDFPLDPCETDGAATPLR